MVKMMRGMDITEPPPEEQLKKAPEIAERIYPMLAGLHPTVQGAIVTDLVAMWIAGHVVEGDPKDTDRLRKFLMEQHIKLVVQLIKPNAEAIGADLLEAEGGSH